MSVTETERSSRWLPGSSLGTLRRSFNAASDDKGGHPDDFSISGFSGPVSKLKFITLWELFPLTQ